MPSRTAESDVYDLLSNAIDALEERDQWRSLDEQQASPSTISIHTQRDDENRVTITISDNDLDSPEALQNKLFDPFFTMKAAGKGTGLRLAISYQIIAERPHG